MALRTIRRHVVTDALGEFRAAIATIVLHRWRAAWVCLRIACRNFDAGKASERCVVDHVQRCKAAASSAALFDVDTKPAWSSIDQAERNEVLHTVGTCKALVTFFGK